MHAAERVSGEIRQAAVAGMFYPSGKSKLTSTIENLLRDAELTQVKGRIVGLIVPHAGYPYSGLTAAYGYRLIIGKSFDTIVIISPSHREYFDGISIYNGYAYQTPLGTVCVDQELRESLLRNESIIRSNELGHGTEHAIEVHLPFLQIIRCTDRFLPVVMGDQRTDYCLHLADKLADALKDRNALVIASSDLSHYHPDDEAHRLDRIVREDIEAFDVKKLMDDLETERIEMCGGGPVSTLLQTAARLGATGSKILHQCTSGDVTGEHDAVVGYLSAVLFAHA